MEKEEIKALIKQAIEKGSLQKDITKISLFGSQLSGTARLDSDIDLLVEFIPAAKIGFFKFIGLQEDLEKNLGRKVDLLTPESLSKHFRYQVMQNAEIIYEG